ncbi:MAG: hypothetical protein WC829_01320 [Hyphomicrobium sp.]|jgi:hypothetical protein
MTDIAALVSEHQQIKAHLEAQDKIFSEYKKPYNERMEQISAQITATMTEQGIKSFKTDTGTAILSTIVTPKVIDREKFLDFVLEDWDTRGAMLQIGAPQKDALQEYMDAHNGALPPSVETSSIVRFSIRKA